MKKYFNIECRKVGGLRFLFIGRLTFMFCISRRGHYLSAEYDRPTRYTRAENRYGITIDG